MKTEKDKKGTDSSPVSLEKRSVRGTDEGRRKAAAKRKENTHARILDYAERYMVNAAESGQNILNVTPKLIAESSYGDIGVTGIYRHFPADQGTIPSLAYAVVERARSQGRRLPEQIENLARTSAEYGNASEKLYYLTASAHLSMFVHRQSHFDAKLADRLTDEYNRSDDPLVRYQIGATLTERLIRNGGSVDEALRISEETIPPLLTVGALMEPVAATIHLINLVYALKARYAEDVITNQKSSVPDAVRRLIFLYDSIDLPGISDRADIVEAMRILFEHGDPRSQSITSLGAFGLCSVYTSPPRRVVADGKTAVVYDNYIGPSDEIGDAIYLLFLCGIIDGGVLAEEVLGVLDEYVMQEGVENMEHLSELPELSASLKVFEEGRDAFSDPRVMKAILSSHLFCTRYALLQAFGCTREMLDGLIRSEIESATYTGILLCNRNIQNLLQGNSRFCQESLPQLDLTESEIANLKAIVNRVLVSEIRDRDAELLSDLSKIIREALSLR